MTEVTPESVELQFKKVKGLTMEKVALVQKAAYFDICKRVIEMTPVDTGRASGGWHGDVNQIKSGPIDFQGSGTDAKARSMASVSAAVAAHKVGDDLTLANGVHYIRYLDQGSSLQAPAGMTSLAILAWKGVVERVTKAVKS